ncbi:MAG: outer membrane protein assembly factor BamD [Planctomycetes bacterium]|nr:outer membrane protein assembly factor BamD [Planctomycetota bacterium]
MSGYMLRAAACAVLLAAVGLPARGGDYVWKNGKWVPGPRVGADTPAGQLALIRRYVEQNRRKDALRTVEKFLARFPDDPACEEALLLAGDAEMKAGRYYHAYEAYERMLDKFPNGRFLERALRREMDIANAFLAGKKRIVAKIFRLPARDEGLTILRRIAEHAPGSLIAEQALLRIGDYYFQRGQYADSAEAYDHYLELFPKSPRAPEAMVRAAEATYESFKGLPYDQTPLIEARQRFKMIIDHYPAAAKKARAAEILKEITDRQAQRMLETARFYARTSRPKAARFYYRRVIEQFPGSTWAATAAAALDRQAPRSRTATRSPSASQSPAVPGEGQKSPHAKPAPAPAAGAASRPGEPPAVRLESLTGGGGKGLTK